MNRYRSNTARLLTTAALLALPAGLCLLALTTVYSADDFFYCTFFDGGLAGWFGQMAEHYRTFNGRMLVHVAATVILRAGNWLFGAAVLLCCLGIWHFSGAYLGREGPWRLSLLLFFGGVLLLPRPIMVEGVLWISACCNYLLPTAMIFCQLWAVKRAAGEGKARVLGLVLSFLCGATTEQCGLAACAVGLEAVLWALRFDRARLRYGGACLMCSALGLGTILLSPGTHIRIRAETGRGLGVLWLGLSSVRVETAAAVICGGAAAAALLILFLRRWRRAGRGRMAAAVLIGGACLVLAGGLAVLERRAPAALALLKRPFQAQAELAAGCPALLVMLGALFLCLGVRCRRKTGKAALSWAMAVLPLSCLAGVALGTAPAACYCLLLLGMTLTALALWLSDSRETGVLLGLAVISVAVMAATNSSSYRTMLPFCLFTLCALVGTAQELFGEGRWLRPAAGALAVLALVRVGMLFPPCWENSRLDRQNRAAAEQARETGTLYYSVDYHMDYTHTKPFFSDYFLLSYLKSEGLPLDFRTVYFYSETLPAVYVDGNRTRCPAALGVDGAYMLAAWHVLPWTGCECQWLDGGSTILWDGVTYQCFRDGEEGGLSWTDGEGAVQTLHFPLVQGFHEVYYPLSVYQELWDLEIVESEGRIDLFTPEKNPG